MGAIVAKLTFTQDFFASSGGRVPYYIAKTAMKIFLGLSIAFLIFSLLPSEFDSQGTGPKVTHTVTFSIEIGGQSVGDVKIGLFGKTVPKTVDNFYTWAQGEQPNGYIGSKFHRVIKDFISKEEISPVEMVLVANPSMVKNSLTKTSSSSITVPDGCPWPTLAKIPMDPNFSSLSRKLPGWTADMLFSER